MSRPLDDRDAQLARRVSNALAADSRTARFARAVEVGVDDRALTLRGAVESLDERGAAGAVARVAADGAAVSNELLVGPAGRSDQEVERVVFDAFTQDRYLDERLIRVGVSRGIVTLEGEVESLTQRRLASGIAWWVRGVRGVVNELRTREALTPEIERDDDLLAAAIKTLFEKDPLVDAVALTPIVRGGVATLAGTVRSQVERSAAEGDAWATPGILDVRNELEVALPRTSAEASESG